MKRNGILILMVMLTALLTLSFCPGACADKGVLSIKCDGSAAERGFISDQRDADVREGARVIVKGGGYVTYRIPVGECSVQNVHYNINMVSHSLKFSPDGRKWSVVVNFPHTQEQPERMTYDGSGLNAESRQAAKKTGMAYFRFTHLPGSKAALVIKSVEIEVTGSPLPKGFGKPQSPGMSKEKLVLLIPAQLMILVGVLSVIICKRMWKTPLRLFWLGALLWVISVAFKAALALALNKPVSAALHHALSRHQADVLFWIFIGLLTGVTEVGIFLAMTKWFQRRQWTWTDAVSVGVGFGAIEAILLGIGMAVVVAVGKAGEMSTFVAPFERLITIFIHMAATTAAIYAVTRRKWGWLIFAFAYKSGVDAVAAYLLLAGHDLLASRPWFVELTYFGPFAYIGIPILLLLRARWDSHFSS